MKLRQPKAFRMFDHHNCGVGDIHSNFYDGCGHEDLQVAAPEGFHHSLFLLALQPAVQ